MIAQHAPRYAAGLLPRRLCPERHVPGARRRVPDTHGDVPTGGGGGARLRRATGTGRRRTGEKLVIWSENRIEWIAALWGTLLARAVLVPVDYRTSRDLVQRISEIVQAKLVLVGQEVDPPAELRGEVWPLADVIRIESAQATTGQAVGPAAVEPTSLAEIIFTSGATAEPKGVTITHRNVLANIVPIEREIGKYRRYILLVHPIRFLNLLPLSHMFGQSMATFVPPMLGGTVVFSHGYSPVEILRQIKSRRVSALVCVPKVLDVLREHLERLEPATRDADPLAGRHWAWRWRAGAARAAVPVRFAATGRERAAATL